MAGSVNITPTSVQVVPGAQTTASVRIRNTGTVVDQFSVTVLGTPAVWTTAVPAVLSLFPGAEGTIELHFAPPRTAEVGAGPVPYGVRVDASQDPDGSVVEEGDVDLLPFVEVQAKLTPRTSETKRKARHEVLVDNRGNSAVEAEIDASDPDEQLAFDVKPRTITVPAGQSVHVPIKVAAKKGFLRGTDKHRPFNVRVNVGQGQGPINLDGTLMQKPGMPRFIVPLVGAAVILALAALVLPALKNDDRSGKLSLTSDEVATTTVPDGSEAEAPAEEPEDPNAPATPEEQAAAAEAERAANGQDSGTTGSGGGDSGTSASGGGTADAPAATTPPPPPPASNAAAEDDGPPPSAVAAPPPSTTAPPAGVSTTTTAPQPIDMFYLNKQENTGEAHWKYLGGAGTVGQTFVANAPVITEVWFNLAGSTVSLNIKEGGPGGRIVGSGPTTKVVSYAMTKIVLATPIKVTTGATYYLEGVVSAGTYAWYSNTNDYPKGNSYLNGVVQNAQVAANGFKAADGHDINARIIGRTS